VVGELNDERRTEPDFLLGERPMLEGWLEFHRTTLLLKCEGLDDAERKARPIPGSLLSLHGLVRHMAEVERVWFQRAVAGRDIPALFEVPEIPDRELFPIDDADWATDLVTWQAECAASRLIAADRQLDDGGTRRGRRVTLRWVLVHMVEEYARHNGHADVIRQLVDGTVGW
jgi:uncharacterized damage-inducible protein DinB